MGFAGDYKVAMVGNGLKEEGGINFISVEDFLANNNDPDTLRAVGKELNTILTVKEDGNIQYRMPIPDETPAEEIEKIKKLGMTIEDGMVVTNTVEGKLENDALYIKDESCFLCGEPWFKISTEVEGELNTLAYIYRKIN